MFIKIIIHIVLISSLLTQMVLADTGYDPLNSCVMGVDINLDKAVLELAQFTACKKINNNKKRCECIQEEISKGESSASYPSVNLKVQIDKYYQQIKDNAEAGKQKYYQQYSDVYKMMTANSAAQKSVMGIESVPNNVGCSPKDMGDNIRIKTKASVAVQIDALKALQKKAVDASANCKGSDCFLLRNKADLIGKNIEAMNGLENKKNESYCDNALKALTDADSKNSIRTMLSHFEKGEEYKDFALGAMSQMGFQWMGFNKDVTGKLAAAWKQFAGIPDDPSGGTDIEKVLTKNNLSCSELIKSYSEMNKYYKYSLASKIEGGDAILTELEKLSPENQCPDHDPICIVYAIKNQQLLSTNAELYSPGKQDESDDSCLTYAEFVTYEGMPSDKLLKELAYDPHPEKLFEETAGWLAHGRNEDKKAFLRANPLIMQLAQRKSDGVNGGPSTADKLGQILKKMSKDMLDNKKEGKAGRLSRYLDFMKGDFADLYKPVGAEAAKMACDDLQSTFTAISLSNKKTRTLNTDDYDRTEKKNLLCVASIYKDTDASDLDSSLKESDLFKMGSDKKGLPSRESYENFKKENCSNIATYKKLGCHERDSKRCNQNNQKFLAERATLREAGISSHMTPKQFGQSVATLDENAQDQTFERIYDQEVTSKLNHNALAGSDDNGEFHNSRVANAGIQNTNNVSEKYEKEKQGGSTQPFFASNNSQTSTQAVGPQEAPSGFEQNSNSPEQVRPVFETPTQVSKAPIPNFESVPQKVMEDARSMTDIDPTFNQRPVEEQLSSFKALKEFVSEGGTSPSFSPTEEIKELEKSLEESKTAIKELEEIKEDKESKIAKASAASAARSPASIPQTSFIAPIASAPVLGQFPGTQSTLSPEVKISKTEASYQAALIQKYQMGSDVKILIQGNDAVVKAPYDLEVENILKADESYPFKALNDPSKLSEFLAVKVGSRISDGQSVKIVDPLTKSYFLLKATVKEGITSYQRYPFVSEEDIHMVKLSDLKNTFNLNH